MKDAQEVMSMDFIPKIVNPKEYNAIRTLTRDGEIITLHVKKDLAQCLGLVPEKLASKQEIEILTMDY